jgi:arabinose-5-phosphate isomerase
MDLEYEIVCDLARSVVETEAKMITSLLPRIDKYFVQACQYLHNCQGRIAVMGMGKSGHIGRKIAATFASTGNPAFFIHPSEAKHGDIGMLMPHDVLLILSNSGETEEVIALLPAIKRLDIPLIALTGRPHSTLAKAATVNLDVSVEKEACPLGLAPTSSTTVALVMGDALAMALLQKRGFTKNDFALSHPGGALGKRLLLRVKELMHTGDAIPSIDYHASVKDALVEITHKKLGMTTIIDQHGHLKGIYTDGDVSRSLDKSIDIHTTPITAVMSKNPKVIAEETLAAEALEIMEAFKITALIVTNDQAHVKGIIHIHDILRAGVI